MEVAAVGFDIGGTNIKMGIVTQRGEVLHRAIVPTEPESGAEALIQKLAGLARGAMDRCADSGVRLGGIGIGTAGQVNARTGEVAGATENLPGWAGVPLTARLQEATGLAVVADNDVNMIALGEAWFGAGRRWEDFLCVALGTGVGGCWIAGRRIYHGRDGYAGEFGHMTVMLDGLPCPCGNRGCWEQYASVTALKRLAGEMSDDPVLRDPVALFDEARKGRAEAIRIVDAYAGYVAVGLAGLIHIFNPPAIVIGGAISEQGDFLLERIRRSVVNRVMPVFNRPDPVEIVPALLGGFAGVIGAAARYFAEATNSGQEKE